MRGLGRGAILWVIEGVEVRWGWRCADDEALTLLMCCAVRIQLFFVSVSLAFFFLRH